MERIAQEGKWLTKTPSNERSRMFYKKVSSPTQEGLDAFEEVTDEYKQFWEHQQAELRKQDAVSDEDE